MMKIFYRKGYKYQLAEDFCFDTGILQEKIIIIGFINLDPDGHLLIKAGYAWDGPSGPTLDTHSSMRGSLVHDALYQLLRLEALDKRFRAEADKLLYTVCIEDGMWKLRAKLWYRAVVRAATSAADPKNVKRIIVSP